MDLFIVIPIMRAPSAQSSFGLTQNKLHGRSGHAIGCSPRPTWLAPRVPVGYLPLSLPELQPHPVVYKPISHGI